MKRNLPIFLFLAILVVAAPVAAQDYEDGIKWSVGAKAGWFWFTDEPLTDFVDNNWIIAGEVIAWFPNGFGIGAEIEYYDDSEENISHAGFDVDVDYSQIPLNLNLYYRFPGNDGFTPYIGGGPSFILTDLSTEANDAPISFDGDESAFGFTVFGGIQYQNFFVEGQYLWADNTLEHAAAGEIDLNAHGFSVWGGFRF